MENHFTPSPSEPEICHESEKTVHTIAEILSLKKEPPVTVNKVSVGDFFREGESLLKLEIVAGGEESLKRVIGEKILNRPALALMNYYKHFASERLQLFGKGEISYLMDLRPEVQESILERFLQKGIPAIVVSGEDLEPTLTMIALANKHKVAVLRSRDRFFATSAAAVLNKLFAPQTTFHATLIDMNGVGVLLCGKSGIGKSECALSLIERDKCALVADDCVEVRLIDENRLVGSGKDIGFGFMECRGIGFVNVTSMFGIRAVKKEKTINLVISLLKADEKESGDEELEDRTGLLHRTVKILGREIPWVPLVVRPGRDIARLVNIAVMVHSLRTEGHDPAVELENRLIAQNLRRTGGGNGGF